MITRRSILLAFGAGTLVASLSALAQQEKRVRRIGYFSGSNAEGTATWLAAFREGMAELRWVEKRDYLIDARYADGVVQAGKDVAASLVATQPEVLLTPTDEAVRLLAQTGKVIPIVFAIAVDPVGSGFAASLQRPGGGATGLTNLGSDLGAKRIQLLKEAFPRVAHIVLLFEPANVGSIAEKKIVEEAAKQVGMRISAIEIRQPRTSTLPSTAAPQSAFTLSCGHKALFSAVSARRLWNAVFAPKCRPWPRAS